jgi:hypothetical protein
MLFFKWLERASLLSLEITFPSSLSTNKTSFQLGNGKRGGAQGTGRSRNGWTNTAFRKKHYGAKKKGNEEKTNDYRSLPGKKRGGGNGRGRGRGRGGGQKKKKAAQ